MKLIFIRHGATHGNTERRYIGRTDEELCETGILTLREKSYPPADVLYTSPMKRCLKTGEIIYPNLKPIVVNDFRECDFGVFEGKNYAELNGREDYQKWIDSGGTMAFPGGEDPADFKKRCVRAFVELAKTFEEDKTAAFAVHGGTIMSIFEAFEDSRDYYRWQAKNACGYVVEWYPDKRKIEVREEL